MLKEIIYLASPYYHESDIVRCVRAKQISELAAKFTKDDLIVLSPITYGHELTKHQDLPGDFSFWNTFCFTFLSKCSKMIVYKMDSWDKSNGIQREILFCNENNIPVEYLEFIPELHKI